VLHQLTIQVLLDFIGKWNLGRTLPHAITPTRIDVLAAREDAQLVRSTKGILLPVVLGPDLPGVEPGHTGLVPLREHWVASQRADVLQMRATCDVWS